VTAVDTAPRDVDNDNFVEEMLQHYRSLAVERMLEALPTSGPPYLYDLMASYLARPAKGLRPALCLAACAAFCGSSDRAVNSAAAVELLHNAFLIFDDIQDESDLRRGEPTLHQDHGIGVAINVANAAYLIGLELLRSNRPAVGSALTAEILTDTQQMMKHTVEGQAIEIGWIRDNVTTLAPADYYRMCLKKTSWYTSIYPLRVGALLGNADGSSRQAMYPFGWYLGAAFQIRDDILNLIGATDRYGKEWLGDLWEGKRTLMLIHQMNAGVAGKRLTHVLSKSRSERSESDVEWLFRCMEKDGSIEFAARSARFLAGAAKFQAEIVLQNAPESEHKRFLLAMPEYVIQRDR
jgi:geranylgeranyl diphosphate synthase, type II